MLIFPLNADLEEEHGKIQEEGRADTVKEGENDSDEDTPVYSLVTGELHSVRRFGHRDDKTIEDGDSKDALVVRNKENALAQRQGLESVAGTYRVIPKLSLICADLILTVNDSQSPCTETMDGS